MKLILYAVPFFFVLIAVELLADRWRGMRTFVAIADQGGFTRAGEQDRKSVV